MKHLSTKKGLTTTELLVSLVLATIFIITSHQLYIIVLNNNLEVRSKAKALNIAYGHLRAISDSINMANCSDSSTTIDRTPNSDENLPNLSIKAYLSAPYKCTNRLMKVEVKVDYLVNGAIRQETQVLYVQK